MRAKRIIAISFIVSFWSAPTLALSAASIDASKLRQSSDRFVDELFSKTDKKPSKEAYLCAYERFENIPDDLKKILAEKGVSAGFENMPKDQRAQYKVEESQLTKGAFQWAAN